MSDTKVNYYVVEIAVVATVPLQQHVLLHDSVAEKQAREIITKLIAGALDFVDQADLHLEILTTY